MKSELLDLANETSEYMLELVNNKKFMELCEPHVAFRMKMERWQVFRVLLMLLLLTHEYRKENETV